MSTIAAPRLSALSDVTVTWKQPQPFRRDTEHELRFYGKPGSLSVGNWKPGGVGNPGIVYTAIGREDTHCTNVFTGDDVSAIKHVLEGVRPVLRTAQAPADDARASAANIVISAFPVDGKRATWNIPSASDDGQRILETAGFLESSVRVNPKIFV